MEIDQLPTIGDPTESAIIKYFEKIESVKKMREKYPVVQDQGREFHVGFDPTKRYSYSIIR